MTQETAIGTRPSPDVWTVGRLLDWTARHFAEKKTEFPRLDAEVLLAYALGCRRIDLYTRYDEEAVESVRGKLRDLIRKRVEGCPVAYLVGRKEFFALPFEVGPAVLIPRPESEFVVMECLRLAEGIAQPRVIDIGTGSGNIAVAVTHQRPDARATATDLSPQALAVARRNAERNGVAARIRFLESDLFAAVPAGETFDFVLSNPPYVATEDLDGLPVGVRHYEPPLALDGGPGGFAVLDRLLADARDRLKPGGHLIVEIGAPQEAEVRRRIGSYSEYELAPTIHDYSGHARVVRARRRP